MKKVILFLATVSWCSGAAVAQPPSFSLPLNCETAPACLLQSLVDLDPTPGRIDPFCGKATYNGHKGTDIRVRTIAELNRGVPVLAMAGGTVLRIRDGVADKLLETPSDRAAVSGKQCGNGVVIDHGNGWTSQTCHLRQGSVQVQPGDKVERGAPIGLMGLSGSTEFPHVHVTIRDGKTVIDPMSGKTVGTACDASSAGTLWTEEAAKTLAAKDSPLIAAGFAGGPVKGVQVLKGSAPAAVPGGPVVFYAQFKNLKKDDRISVDVYESGTRLPVASHVTEPLDRAKATYTVYAGRGAPGYRPGGYVATVVLSRDGKTVYRGDFP